MSFKEPTADQWVEAIDEGLDFRRQFGLEDLWGKLEAMYYNVHDSMQSDTPNILLSQGDSMLSTITVPSPRVRVDPRSPTAVSKAPLLESLDNLLIETLEIPIQIEHAALLAYLFGFAALKIGYDSEWGYAPEHDIAGTVNPIGLTLTQMNKQTTRRLEYNERIAAGMPWVRAVLPHDLVLPYGTKDICSSPWVATRVIRQIDELRADVKYEKVSRLEPTLSMKDFVQSYRGPLSVAQSAASTDPEFVEFYEIQDRRTGMLTCVVPDSSKIIRRVENALQINNRLPFVGLSFTPRTRSAWTTPDAYYLYHIQKEIADVVRQRTKQRRMSVLKFLYDGNVISDAELMKLMSPDVGVAAKVEAGQKITDAIMRLDNHVNPTFQIEEEHLRQNAREQIGFSRNQLGEYSGGRKTATEVSTVDRSSQLRMSRRGLAVRRAYEGVFEIINGMIFSFWSLPRYVSVLGENAGLKWQSVTGLHLNDRYAYNITLVDEADLRQRGYEALQMYSILSQDPSIDPVALREYLISGVGDPRLERIFNADIQRKLSALRAAGGLLQQNGDTQGGGTASLQNMRPQDNQNANGTDRLTVAS
jgi:hypothetical protein